MSKEVAPTLFMNEFLQVFIYSICYQFFHDLSGSGAQAGSNVTLSIDLVDGTTFKIIGLMLCSY
jgi:hypothetical protein